MSPELADGLASLAGVARAELWAAFVVFLRVGGAVALLPAFGETSIPARVRLVLALAFTLVVLPAVSGLLPPPPASAAGTLGLVLSEAAAGVAFGLFIRLFVLALQTAGAIAAQAIALSQIFGASAGGEPSPVVTHLLVTAGLALAALLGLPERLAAYLILGYDLVPPGAGLAPAVLLDAGVGEVARSFGLAFSLSAPFVLASLLYNVALGVASRAMPQLMVTFIGAPAMTLGGLALLALALPFLLALWAEALGGFLLDPFGPRP